MKIGTNQHNNGIGGQGGTTLNVYLYDHLTPLFTNIKYENAEGIKTRQAHGTENYDETKKTVLNWLKKDEKMRIQRDFWNVQQANEKSCCFVPHYSTAP
jgi:hypothetical protein